MKKQKTRLVSTPTEQQFNSLNEAYSYFNLNRVQLRSVPKNQVCLTRLLISKSQRLASKVARKKYKFSTISSFQKVLAFLNRKFMILPMPGSMISLPYINLSLS